MLLIAGYIIATVVGLGIVLYASRWSNPRRDESPWPFEEIYNLHVVIVASLAGFAYTGIVLVVTFARERPGTAQVSLDTVIVMFLVAYLWWIGAAFLMSYLPHIRTSGDLAQRVHFSLASTIEYRTVFISWFALLPLLQANGLGRLAGIINFFLPASLLLGSILLAMATDRIGLLTVKDTYFSAIIAFGLSLAYAAVAAVVPGARSPYASLYLAVVIFCVNGAGFALASLTPLAPRYKSIERFYDRYGRRIIIADTHLTMNSLAFLWLAVIGGI